MRWILLAVSVACVAALSVFATLAAGLTGQLSAQTVRIELAPGGSPDKLKPLTGIAKAGQITFAVANQSNIPHKTNGATDLPSPHELVVLKTNLAPNKLPLNKSSSAAVETGRVGKPLLVSPGKTRTITLNLKPGKYVLICNLAYHYQSGQYAAFKVVG